MEKLMIKNVLNKFGFARIALVAGAGLPLIFASNAFAQAPPPPPPDTLGGLGAAPTEAVTERVIVTGSNIPTAQEESSLPVTTYTADFLTKAGAGTPVEGLRQLPSFVGNASTENNANGGTGAATINLRGLGDQNTVILINGVRTFLGENFDGRDVNFIGISSINNAQVLKDGASSVYGSDAVAGVVDFQLWGDRRLAPYEGAEFEVRYGTTTDTDANERQAWIRGGVTGMEGKVAIFASAEYYNRAELDSLDRTIAVTGDQSNGDIPGVNPPLGLLPMNLGGINNNSPTFAGRVSVAGAGNGQLVLNDLTNSAPTRASYRRFEPNQFSNPPGPIPGSGEFPVGADPSRFNFRAFTPTIPPFEKSLEYVTGRYKVFGDSLEIYGDMMYSHYRQNNAIAGAPFILFNGPPEDGGDNVQLSPFNPFGGSIRQVRYRTQQELGQRSSTYDKDWWRWVGGMRGSIDLTGNGFISRVGYDAAFVYERFEDTRTDGGDLTRSLLDQQVLAGVFNPFIGQLAPTVGVAPTYINGVPSGTAPYNNEEGADAAAYIGHSLFHEKDLLFSVTANASLFPNLWNGGFDIAGGFQHFRKQEHSIPDPVQAAGDQLGFNQAPNFKFQTETTAWFGELRLPFVISTMNVPFIYSFEVGYSYRYERFKDHDLTNPGEHLDARFDNGGNHRLTIRWQPTPDLLLRGTWGQSFLAPVPDLLFTPPFEDFPVLFDPVVRATFQPPEAVLNLPNTNLKPEDTETWTAGAVYSPKFLPGFTLTADWYQVFTTDLIVTANDFAQLLLVSDPFNPVIRRDEQNNVISIDSQINNAGKRFVQGLDVTAIYQLPTTNFGRFTFTLGWNHFFTWKASLGPGSPFHDFLGDGFTQAIPLTPGGVPWNKGFLRGEWEYKLWQGNFDFIAQINYIGAQEDDPAFILGNELVPNNPGDGINPNWVQHRTISAYTTLDLQASYEFVRPPVVAPVPGYTKEGKDFKSPLGKQPVAPVVAESTFWQRMLWGTKITAGVVNAFDRNPPTGLAAFNDNYDTTLYSIRNRFWYVALSKKF
jgi:iron complex outermembrane receptor protein